MKRRSIRIMQFMAILAVAVLTVALAAGYTDIADVFAFLGLGGSATLAAAGATAVEEGTTPVTTPDGNLRHYLDNEISKEITKMKPALTPLDTILRKTNKVVPTKSWETEWYTVDVRDTQDALDANVTASDTATTWTAYDIKVKKIHMWSVDDIIRVNGVTGIAASGSDLILHVVHKDASSSILKVIPVNSNTGTAVNGIKYGMPAITAAGSELTRIGNAKAEKDAQSSPYAIFPAKSSNYAQIHMAQVEESVYQRMHKKEIEWNMDDWRLAAIYDMKRSMESTSIFGVKGKIYDTIGDEWKYLSGGLTSFIPQSLGYEYTASKTTLSNDLFLNWAKQTFVGNSGSEKRFMFVGSDLMEYLGSVGTITKQIEAKQVEVVYGINFNRIETPFGVFLIKHHQLLDDSYWSKNGIILDLNNIERHVFKPMETRELEFIKSGQKMAKGYVIDETFCLALRYPDTHRIIKGTAGQ